MNIFILSEQLFETHYPQTVLLPAIQVPVKYSHLLLQQSNYNAIQVLCFHFLIQFLGLSDQNKVCHGVCQMN